VIKFKTNRFVILLTLSTISTYLISSINESYFSHKFFHDDSYYYFEISKNFIETNKFTFDSVSSTNGFHFLWLFCLISVSFLFKLFLGILINQLWVAIFLSITFFLLSFEIISRTYSQKNIDKIIIFIVFVLFIPFFFNGMETALTIYLFILYIDRVFISNKKNNLLLVVLLMFSRYDSIFLLFFISLYKSIKNKKLDFAKHFFLAFLIFLILLLSFNFYLGFNNSEFSVSSSTKQFWNQIEYQEHISKCEEINLNCKAYFVFYQFKLIPDYMSNVNKLLFSIFDNFVAYNSFGKISNFSIFSILIVLYFFLSFNFIKKPIIKTIDLNFLIIVATFHLTSISLISYINISHDWYNYFFIAIYIYLINEVLIRKNTLIKFSLSFLIVGNLLIFLFSPVSYWSKSYENTVDTLNLYENKIIGTWAAGHIGFYSENPVINLEGLVGNSRILEANMTKSLDKYILNNIDIIVTNFDLNNSYNTNWFLNLRTDPLNKISNNLKLVRVVTTDQNKYNMYIYEVLK